jgi:hypothetical protein
MTTATRSRTDMPILPVAEPMKAQPAAPAAARTAMPFRVRVPVRRNADYQWHLGCSFTDLDGSHRADWQMLRPEGGACYEVHLRDGIPVEEHAPEGWTKQTRLGLRNEITQHEQTRLGLATPNAAWDQRIMSTGIPGDVTWTAADLQRNSSAQALTPANGLRE